MRPSPIPAKMLEVFTERTDPKTGLAKVSDRELQQLMGCSRRWTEACIRKLKDSGRIEVDKYDEPDERRRVVRVIR